MKFEGMYKLHKNENELTNRLCYFEINSEDITLDMTDDDLFGLFMDLMYDDFDANIGPGAQNIDKFIEWTRANKLVADEVE